MASNPDYPVSVIAGQWNLITPPGGVKTGWIKRITDNGTNRFLQTIRVANEPAPISRDEGAIMFELYNNAERINSDTNIDVYVWPLGQNGVLRVDV